MEARAPRRRPTRRVANEALDPVPAAGRVSGDGRRLVAAGGTAEAEQHVGLVRCVPVLVFWLLPGLCLGPAGPLDALALLAWAAVTAPACGAIVSLGEASFGRLRLGPLLAAAGFAATLALAQQLGGRPVPEPLWGGVAVVGLLAGGAGLAGSSSGGGGVGRAGLLAIACLALSGGPVLFGLADEGRTLGSSHPRLAHALLEVAPDGLVLEAAGVDWAHTNPTVYAVSGVEWVPRAPRGPRAALVVLAAGLGLWTLRSWFWARGRGVRGPRRPQGKPPEQAEAGSPFGGD